MDENKLAEIMNEPNQHNVSNENNRNIQHLNDNIQHDNDNIQHDNDNPVKQRRL